MDAAPGKEARWRGQAQCSLGDAGQPLLVRARAVEMEKGAAWHLPQPRKPPYSEIIRVSPVARATIG